jgi:hypothetical protein
MPPDTRAVRAEERGNMRYLIRVVNIAGAAPPYGAWGRAAVRERLVARHR